MPVAIILAIGVVVAVLVGDRVGERETVMRGEEIDAAEVSSEQIGRTRDPGGKRPHSPGPAPKPADIVAESVVPFEPVGGEAPQLVAARANIPRLGNHHPVSEQRVGSELGEDRGVGIEARPAGDHGR